MTNAYLELEKKKDDTQATDLSSKTILQQYWLVKDKYNLDKEDIVSLTADFIMAGVDTVCNCKNQRLETYLDVFPFFFLNSQDKHRVAFYSV